MDRWVDGQIDRWVDGQMGGQNKWIDGQLDRWVYGQMDKWADGQMDRWIYGQMGGIWEAPGAGGTTGGPEVGLEEKYAKTIVFFSRK